MVQSIGKSTAKDNIRRMMMRCILPFFFLKQLPNSILFNDEIKQENTVGGYEVSGTGHVERKQSSTLTIKN
jgi:hypothetical protein